MSDLDQMCEALTTISGALSRAPDATVAEVTWTADGDAHGRPVLVVHVDGDTGPAVTALGWTEVPIDDRRRMWEGPLCGLQCAIVGGGWS